MLFRGLNSEKTINWVIMDTVGVTNPLWSLEGQLPLHKCGVGMKTGHENLIIMPKVKY